MKNEELEKIRFEKKKKGGLRKCPGHKHASNWTLDVNDICNICGGHMEVSISPSFSMEIEESQE